MSIRSYVENLFGPLHEQFTYYYSEIAEEVLWTEDKLTPGGRTYRIAFMFGKDEEDSEYFLVDLWWDSPVLSSQIGGMCLHPEGRTIHMAEKDVQVMHDHIHGELLGKIDLAHDEMVAKANKLRETKAGATWHEKLLLLDEDAK